jgi:ABC-type glycerol-3-phosphate transport system substrate-binding protein
MRTRRRLSARKVHLLVSLGICALLAMGGIAAHAADKEVVIWLWNAHMTNQYQSWADKVTASFEIENPGATLRFEYTDNWTSEKLIVAIAGGAPPDISLVSMSRARTFYELGMLTELNAYVDKTPHMALDKFLPTAVPFIQKGGKIYGLPWSLEANVVLYNREFLNESGLDDRPQALGSWDDLVSYARTLVKRDANQVIQRSGMILAKGVPHFAAYLYSNGGQFYNESGTSAAFNDSKGVQTLQMMVDYAREHDVTRVNAVGWRDIGNRTTAMAIGDTSSVNFIQPVAPDFVSWLGMAPIPRGPQGTRPSTASWSNMFSIPRGAKNPDLAWNFIKLWLKPEMVIQHFQHFGGQNVTSPRRDFLQSHAFRAAMQDIPWMRVIPEVFNNAGPYPFIRFPDITAKMGPLLTRAEKGEMAPAAALLEAQRIVNAILQE